MLSNTDNSLGSASIGVRTDDLGFLIEEIKRGLPYSAFESLQQAIGISRKKLAEAININSRTLARRQKELRFQPDESERLLRIGRIVDRTLELMDGNLELARAWLTENSVALGGKSPLEFADTEPGAREVMTLIGRLEHGVFS